MSIRTVVLPILLAATTPAIDAADAAAPPLPNPDFTAGEGIPEGADHDWNLGPTGLRGWMHCDRMETDTARQIMVTRVDSGSPADGRIEVGDVILGLGTRTFRADPRIELGRAIGRAERSGGSLVLLRWRDGRRDRVRIELPVLGRYSETAPFDCRKSEKILDRGCDALARGLSENPDRGTPIERSYAALALLAGGDPDHLPVVRAQVERAAAYTDPDRRQYHSWFYGPQTILVAEYVIATDDRTVLPDLERLALEIARGQSEVGSWGHRFVQTAGPDRGRLAGYGMMNAPGVPLLIGLVLAREAGVDHPEVDEAIDRGARLVRFYVGKGSVPYGDHAPWIENHDDNGKNGAAAVLFNLLQDPEATTYFSRMSVACHGVERDTGHTGNYFNTLWAMPAIALSGPEATGAWTEECAWKLDLARRWDGTFTHQGPAEPRYDSYKLWDASGTFLLAYAQPDRRIHLTGRTPSVAPRIDRRTAKGLVDDGRGWSPRTKLAAYGTRTDRVLLEGLESWSPVVRERSAIELANREGVPTPALRRLLRRDDPYSPLGACQAAIMLRDRAAPLVEDLHAALSAQDPWLRIKAAEALAAIGDAAMPALPELLEMLAEDPDPSDPRGMIQRYLCFALFNQRQGLIGRSLEGVDPDALRTAVVAGLANQDGRAREAIGSVYRNLPFESLEPLLPEIHAAILEPAPSGIMFADGIRLQGLELLARHRLREGIPLCIDLIAPERWGMGNRIERCLQALRSYGGAAREELPRLQALHEELIERGWNPPRMQELDLPGIAREIREDDAPAPLRSIATRTGEGR
ncbi:MAG: DUF6288 domain-containing protein [Planctomycetota bacterium]|nr:DUF6288 domain-containing protein [Planctomycetota bacterium]